MCTQVIFEHEITWGLSSRLSPLLPPSLHGINHQEIQNMLVYSVVAASQEDLARDVLEKPFLLLVLHKHHNVLVWLGAFYQCKNSCIIWAWLSGMVWMTWALLCLGEKGGLILGNTPTAAASAAYRQTVSLIASAAGTAEHAKEMAPILDHKQLSDWCRRSFTTASCMSAWAPGSWWQTGNRGIKTFRPV